MEKFSRYKREVNKYGVLSLKSNPFSIAPLFRNFKDKAQCEQEEIFFTIPGQLEEEIEIFISSGPFGAHRPVYQHAHPS